MKPAPSMMSSGALSVTKASPVVVRPSETELVSSSPTAAGDTATAVIPLSSFDKSMTPFPVTSLLAFDRPIDEPAETIKRALSRALAHYRPLAGRIRSGDGGGVACTGAGATFVRASASCALEDATAVAALQRAGADDLAVLYPGPLCRDDADPLLLVQVTEFSCGGFLLAVTWNHAAADGTGMAQFVRAVGELARGVSPPSVAPARRWDDSLPGLPASTVAALRSALGHEPDQRLALLDFVVPASLIGRIKAGAFGAGGERCTVFEAVAAVLWRCRTRAALAPGEAQSPAPLNFTCNVRPHIGTPAGYYGNCVVTQVVPATSGVVANSSIGDLVRLIRRAKEEVPALLSGDGGVAGTADGQAPLWYEALVVTSWRNMGWEEADMGGGRPARVMWYAKRMVAASCVVCPPCRDGEDGGVRVSSLMVKPEHADAFLGELTVLAASSGE